MVPPASLKTCLLPSPWRAGVGSMLLPLLAQQAVYQPGLEAFFRVCGPVFHWVCA